LHIDVVTELPPELPGSFDKLNPFLKAGPRGGGRLVSFEITASGIRRASSGHKQPARLEMFGHQPVKTNSKAG
jgi:hypothetical protein